MTMKTLLAITTAIAAPTIAYAASIALPGVVFTTPSSANSTSIACTQTAASNLVVPVAAGAQIFDCTVQPSSWTGTVTLSGGPPFTLTAPVGNKVTVVLSAAVTTAGTLQPGTLTASP